MDNTIIQTNFPITVYGNLEKFTDVMSRGRCRIFYKYENRNGTYITDEFAEELVKTLPYTPVKGIYEDGDYADHGASRDLGRIYGIVPGPQDMDFAWETHLDDDGKERVYACVNVYYYTALYEEAGEINGKSQSMELYRKSIVGDWQFINGKKYYVFEKASFLGLQVLGDEVEPCFEGAGFFSLYESVKDLCAKLEKYQENFQNHGEGVKDMPTITFKLSDSQKYDFLWSLLNPAFCEEGGWTVDAVICEVYDEYAVVRNFVDGCFERVYYAKDDETDSLSITNRERCFIVDVNETEREALRRLESTHGTYEAADAKFVEVSGQVESLTGEIATRDTTIADMTEEISARDTKIEELGGEISTLTTERDEAVVARDTASASLAGAETELSELRTSVETLTTQNATLADFQYRTLKAEKESVISGYTNMLSSDVLDRYTADIDNYTAEQLDKELTYELKLAGATVFSQSTPPAYIPKASEPTGGISSILAKYQKK